VWPRTWRKTLPDRRGQGGHTFPRHFVDLLLLHLHHLLDILRVPPHSKKNVYAKHKFCVEIAIISLIWPSPCAQLLHLRPKRSSISHSGVCAGAIRESIHPYLPSTPAAIPLASNKHPNNKNKGGTTRDAKIPNT